MRKITVFDFCSQIGAASDEIPVVVKAGMQEIGHFRSLYKIPAQAMPGVLEAKITYVKMLLSYAELCPSAGTVYYLRLMPFTRHQCRWACFFLAVRQAAQKRFSLRS